MNGQLDTDSETDDDGISGAFEGITPEDFRQQLTANQVVDAIIVEDTPQTSNGDRGSRRGRSRTQSDDSSSEARDAKSGPPSLDEWTGFFSRVVLKTATQWYLNYAFRGIDEDMLSEREIERMALTENERKTIAVPFAELSNKSKFMRKHGRTLVASGDAFNAAVVLGAWMTRVNKIASKYRPREPKADVRINGHSRQGSAEGNGTTGSTGGRFPEGFYGPIFPGTG